MRLVSLNTWKSEGDFPKRVHATAEGLAALFADVIALQEDLRTSDGLTHTALALARALSMQLTWAPAWTKPRSVGLRRTVTSSGLAILCRQPALEQRVIALPEDAWDGERIAQCVRLPGGAGGWWLVNLHLTHLPDRTDLRRMQLETVLQAMDRMARDQRVVLCGTSTPACGCRDRPVPVTGWAAGRCLCRLAQGHTRDRVRCRARSGPHFPAHRARCAAVPAAAARVALDRPGARWRDAQRSLCGLRRPGLTAAQSRQITSRTNCASGRRHRYRRVSCSAPGL